MTEPRDVAIRAGIILSGSEMTERESYERVVEGLKMAADGAKQICLIKEDMNWQRIAWAIDCTRKAIVDRARMGDTCEISPDLPRLATMTVTAAFVRHIDGLRQAIGGLRQMAVSHRQQQFWLNWVRQLEDMREKAGILLRQQGSPLILPGSMQ